MLILAWTSLLRVTALAPLALVTWIASEGFPSVREIPLTGAEPEATVAMSPSFTGPLGPPPTVIDLRSSAVRAVETTSTGTV